MVLVMKKYNFLWFMLIIMLYIFPGCGGNNSNPANISSNSNNDTNNSQTELPAQDAELKEHVPSEIIVHYQSSYNPDTIAENISGRVLETFSIDEKKYARIEIPNDQSIVDSIKSFEAKDDNGVIYAEPNYIYHTFIVPNDTYYSSYQYAPQNCNAEAGWNTQQGANTVIIAIVDTGVNGIHPEFSGKMVAGYDYVNNRALTGGENSDDNGHGTHVSGIAAATGNNAIGIAGVAWGCKIMPLKVLNSAGSGSEAAIVNGMTWAKNNGAKVINLSLGGPGYAQVITDAIQAALAANVIVVAAMGNDYHAAIQYPAASQGAIGVGAINGQNAVTDYSTRGDHICISAPGDNVYSTSFSGAYEYKSGTSMATPFISGVCALILSQYGAISPEQVRSQLELTATDLDAAGWDRNTGWGKPNIQAAMGGLQANKYGRVAVSTDPVRAGLSVVVYDNGGNYIGTTKTNAAGVAYFYYINEANNYTAKAYYNATTRQVTFNVTAGATTNTTINNLN